MLKDKVKITSRFQRSVRIDSDLKNSNALEGFVCPKSSADVLLMMSRHVSETGQCAFTWTGPYGTGKSSLAVALGSLLNCSQKNSSPICKTLGEEISNEILQHLSPNGSSWSILPVVGRRGNPVSIIGEALNSSGLLNDDKTPIWSESKLVEYLLEVSQGSNNKHDGLIVFIDEMGKILEGAARSESDVYFFQLLAEAASRSNKRLIIIGVLHQSFEDYANRLSRKDKDEWSKIQGRFIDLPVNVSGEEQIDLLSRAIISHTPPKEFNIISQNLQQHISSNKPGVSATLADMFFKCWPIHPVVASLLGSISRRRFGQNQRSLFGFLNSAEPHAFQDFLISAKDNDLYGTEHLWEYLRTNLEPSIMVSPDGHKWSLAVEAVERCEAQVNDDLTLKLLKSIALIGLFKGNSGLIASQPILEACHYKYSSEQITEALNKLRQLSYIIYKAYLNSYAVYAGSDFDIDGAVIKAREEIRSINFDALKKLSGLQPILAKKHYHITGTMRWFDVELVPLNQINESALKFLPSSSITGKFLLAIPTENENISDAKSICQMVAKENSNKDVVIGFSKKSWTINELAMEILATELVFNESPELGGDSVARREVVAKLSDLQGQLETEIHNAFDQSIWFCKNKSAQSLSHKDLSKLASDLVDKRFNKSPRIHNELLNRIKPSSSAVAGQNALLKKMVMNEGEPRLGIEGFPAEGGLFASLLDKTQVYDKEEGRFVCPSHGDDACNLLPIWDAAYALLTNNNDRAVGLWEIYEAWKNPPYGVREGLLPVLAVAYVLSMRNNLAFYRDGIFQTKLKDIDVEILVKDPKAIQLRYIDLSDLAKSLLSQMAKIVRELNPDNKLTLLEPIDVGRGLIQVFDDIHPWAKRTMHLSKNALMIRNLFKKANDPNKFLFDDIPALLGNKKNLDDSSMINEVVDIVYNGLNELTNSFYSELSRLREIMLEELQVPNHSPQALEELRSRAKNIQGVSGEFRLDAYITRLSTYEGSWDDMEGIASLAANKPPRLWIDSDIDKARIELSSLAQQFIKAEAFARVKGRKDKRHAMSVIVNRKGRPTPLDIDFDILESETAKVESLASEIKNKIFARIENKNLILAALADLSSTYIEEVKNNNVYRKS